MEEDYSTLDESNPIPSMPSSREYYWILAVDKTSGRPVVLGYYHSEEEANRVGFEKIDGSFEVVPLKTTDSAKATKILKYKRFYQTARLEEALKRARHQTERKKTHGIDNH